MIKKNLIFLGIPLIFMSGISFGQNELDALRFSQSRPIGTAFSAGMSGAVGAVGADMTSYSINPAAIAFYRNGEFNASLDILNTRTTSRYLGLDRTDGRYGFNLPNISYVATHLEYDRGREPDDDLVSYSFGFQMNRTWNFHNKTFYQGQNNQSSYLDMIWERSQGFFEEELGSIEYLAYKTWLLDPGNAQDQWTIPTDGDARKSFQSGEIISSGGAFDYNVGGGFNYGNKFYGGINLFYNRINYKESNTFREDNDLFLESFETMEVLFENHTRGGGFGAKLGGIARLSEEFRAGFSFHTPTVLNLRDEYFYEVSSTYHPSSSQVPPDGLAFTERDPFKSGPFDPGVYGYRYRISTPARFNISAAYVTPRFGILSMDIERVDYSTIGMKADDFNFFNANTAIRSDFRTVTNVRLGTEILNGDFRIRGGIAYNQSPFNPEVKAFKDVKGQFSYSGGFGIRKEKFGFDVAYARTNFQDVYYPYVTVDAEFPSSTVRRTNRISSFIFSLLIFIQ